ncbi:MAG TPA: acetoacetate--CoA ligase [Burkholderiales bacterium]|nr:acetoacetate--CoA ligase [Burkholderiales bacterium]
MIEPIWTPTRQRVAESNLTAFMTVVNERLQRDLRSYDELHAFSIREPGQFWSLVAEFCGVQFDVAPATALKPGRTMASARFFPAARLNAARTLLAAPDSALAIISLREDGQRREMTFGELRSLVSRLTQAMRAAGVGVGDRVASLCPSVPETVAAMLATLAVGAVWAACSPEYGVAGTLDRIGQISPKLLFAADGYLHGGVAHDLTAKAGQIARSLPSLAATVLMPLLDADARMDGALALEDFVESHRAGAIDFVSVPFDQPAFILFSSGTTGAPKCIVHGAGGPLLENLKAHKLQFDVKPGDRVYFPCTTGWMVWNVMTFALGCGASIVLYDGSAFHPDVDRLVQHTADEKVTLARWAARYVDRLAKEGVRPADTYDLSALKTLMCNGSVFAADAYEYVYSKVKRDVHLISPSGGTDSFGSLVSSNPTGPVWAGEIQCRALGFAVDVFDANGQPLRGRPGELVITQPFPSMPLHYLNDPDGERMRSTYFDVFPQAWRHGDWAEITEHNGIVIHGRSDATLNAKGIRIGTSEIYRQLAEVPEVAESVVVAQDWDGDTRVVLFVRLRPGLTLDSSLEQRLRARLRENLSPRHVPKKILQVQDIPVTITGKVSESAVREAIHGRPPQNASALANPEALAHFAPALHQDLARP